MADGVNILSKNIKFLRKSKKLSQEELALKLGIKRSNIAAYETKNVEPRLRIILEIAKLFDIDIQTFIQTELNNDLEYNSFSNQPASPNILKQELNIQQNTEINSFVAKSIKIRKVLEGFKAFYSFKKNGISNSSPGKEKLVYDIDNFIQLMEHLLTYNESVIRAISNAKSLNSE
jgi:transcriptional regulator with XRE-family HTH domain